MSKKFTENNTVMRALESFEGEVEVWDGESVDDYDLLQCIPEDTEDMTIGDFLDDDNYELQYLISEYADGKVDIYYKELFEFAVEHEGVIADMIEEHGIESMIDENQPITSLSQRTQYFAYEIALRDLLEEFRDFLKKNI